MFQRLVISLAVMSLVGCDVDEAAQQIVQPSQTDLEAIADGPPSLVTPAAKDLTSVQHPVYVNGWNRICADSLTLKSAPGGAGGALDTLYNGYWFYKTDTNGAWSSGYSYERDKWGWVLSQYLCTP